MAKGASKSVVEMLECQEALVNTDELEAATEWRAVGYWRSRRSCTVGPVMILIAGLMMCSILLPIPCFYSWRGIGCGITRAPRRPAWMGRAPIRAGLAGGRGVSRPVADCAARPQLPPCAGA